MANPIVLLCVLNILPQSVLEIIAEIRALEDGGSHSPFGGSKKIGPYAKRRYGEKRVFAPFDTDEKSCREGLARLVGSRERKTGLAAEDSFGFRITYKGLFLLPEIIRDIRKQYPLPAIPQPVRVFQPKEDVPWMLSPQELGRLADDYKRRYA